MNVPRSGLVKVPSKARSNDFRFLVIAAPTTVKSGSEERLCTSVARGRPSALPLIVDVSPKPCGHATWTSERVFTELAIHGGQHERWFHSIRLRLPKTRVLGKALKLEGVVAAPRTAGLSSPPKLSGSSMLSNDLYAISYVCKGDFTPVHHLIYPRSKYSDPS